MRILSGTSGFSYKEWKGSFYPAKLKSEEMLRFYAERLPAVELNNTFYRMPRTSALESWVSQVPESFRFSVKASRRITHIKRLKDAEEETTYLLDKLAILGERLGVVLFQLPPYLRKDLPRLETFIALLPAGTRAAFEFRHESWLDDDVLSVLGARNFALCAADTDEDEAPLLGSADWGYLRLRRSSYDDAALSRWHAHLAKQDWHTAFVFFKHEDEGAGPALARRFLEIA